MSNPWTRGPWHLSNSQIVKCSVYDKDGKPIAHCDRRGSETLHNARLIAAAPNMARKLAETVEWLEREVSPRPSLEWMMLKKDNPELYALLRKWDELRDDLAETLRKVRGE